MVIDNPTDRRRRNIDASTPGRERVQHFRGADHSQFAGTEPHSFIRSRRVWGDMAVHLRRESRTGSEPASKTTSSRPKLPVWSSVQISLPKRVA
jgi:hypothetical protein